jgi:hypothetical protein
MTARIERAPTIGRPLGAPEWIAALERQFGRRLAPGKPGPSPEWTETTSGNCCCCENQVNCHRNPANCHRNPDLLGIAKRIVDAKAQFRSLAEPWADSTSSTGRLMLAVLGGLADVERDLIRTSTAEARSRASD